MNVIFTLFLLTAVWVQVCLAYLVWPDSHGYVGGASFMFGLWLGASLARG